MTRVLGLWITIIVRLLISGDDHGPIIITKVVVGILQCGKWTYLINETHTKRLHTSIVLFIWRKILVSFIWREILVPMVP